MVTAKELTDRLVAWFDPSRSMKIQEAITRILVAEGCSQYDAAEEAERVAQRVIYHLQQRTPYELPFEFSPSDSFRLIGKRRARRSDSPSTLYARAARELMPGVIQMMAQLSADEFEVLCALALRRSGAKEAFALKTHDEGGVDFFGRISVKPHIPEVPTSLLRTSFLDWKLFILGQAKCLNPGTRIGRDEIQKFAQQVRDCLRKYRDNPDPPKHRVPPSYYVEEEPCLPIFMTTARFSDRAPGAALSSGIRLVEGTELAEFLIAHRIGVSMVDDSPVLSFEEFRSWLFTHESEVNITSAIDSEVES